MVIRPTTSTTEVPTALTIKPIGGTHLWATDDTVWDAGSSEAGAAGTEPAPTTLINDLRSPQPIETADSKRTDGATLAVAADDRLAGMNSGSIEPVAYSAASRTLTTPRVEDLPRPAPFWPADDGRDLSIRPHQVRRTSSPRRQVSRRIRSRIQLRKRAEPTPVVQSPSQSAAEPAAAAGRVGVPIARGSVAGANSPQTKRQVQDGMEQLRKLLEGGGNAPRGETVAAPSPRLAPLRPAAGAILGTNREPRLRPSAKVTRPRARIQDADIRDVLEMIATQGQINILPSNSVKGRVWRRCTTSISTRLAAI